MTAPAFSQEASFLRVQQRFVELARVPEDWDSYGAAAVAPHAIARAQGLIMDVLRAFPLRAPEELLPFDLLPLPDGSVQLIWQGACGELDLDVNPDGRIGYLVTIDQGGGRRRDEVDDVSPQDLIRVLREQVRL